MNQFLQYAKNYSCTVQQAISDRDFPMNEEQCTNAFIEALGRAPTKQEIKEMSPDSAKVMRHQSELQDWEDFDMGRR